MEEKNIIPMKIYIWPPTWNSAILSFNFFFKELQQSTTDKKSYSVDLTNKICWAMEILKIGEFNKKRPIPWNIIQKQFKLNDNKSAFIDFSTNYTYNSHSNVGNMQLNVSDSH